MEQAMLLQQLRPPVDRQRARSPRQFGELGADVAHKTLPADAVADSLCDWREVQIGLQVDIPSHGLLSQGLAPVSGMGCSANSARIAQAIRTSA